MKKRIIITASLFLFAVGCEGVDVTVTDNTDDTDTTAPTISSLKDDAGNAIAPTGSSVLVDGTFIITFSEAMAPATVTGYITLTCSGTAVEISVAVATDTDSIADNEFAIIHTANFTLGETCVLTLAAASITDAAGNALWSADVTYTFSIASSSAPSISSLVDAQDTAISATASENTTRISGLTTNTYTVTFSVPMDPDTLTADNVPVTCSVGTAPTITFAAATDSDGIADNEFVGTLSAQLPQYTDCTLAFGTGVTDTAGTALAETAYSFNTKCATSDDFSNPTTFVLADAQANTDGISGCWAHGQPAGVGAYTFAISDVTDTLDFNGPSENYTGTPRIGINKPVTATDLTVIVDLASVEGIDSNNDRIRLSIYNSDGTAFFLIDFRYHSGVDKCQAAYSPPATVDALACNDDATIEGLKIVKTGTTFEGYYKLTTGADYVLITTQTGIDVGSPYSVGIFILGAAGTGDDNIVSFDSFTVTGGSAINQD